ncbi:MAG: hypothetical protein IPL47_16610 [Phyllobacteriaceae bacterium]|nr:hypothetical protein [Phyllobacteriaceae bacterium]
MSTASRPARRKPEPDRERGIVAETQRVDAGVARHEAVGAIGLNGENAEREGCSAWLRECDGKAGRTIKGSGCADDGVGEDSSIIYVRTGEHTTHCREIVCGDCIDNHRNGFSNKSRPIIGARQGDGQR